MQRDIGNHAVGMTSPKDLVVEVHALGIDVADALRKDATPGDGDADAVDAKALAELEVMVVLMIEVRCRIGREATPLRQEAVPRHRALTMAAGLALALVGSGCPTKHEAFGKRERTMHG